MVGNLKVGNQIRQTRIRFRTIDENESYINAIDQDYDTKDAFLNGYTFKINSPQFKKVNREVNMVMDLIISMEILNIEVLIDL